MNGFRNISSSLLIFLLLTMAGCGGSNSSVSGTITFKDKPIENGSVRFFPMKPTEGDGAIAAITAGKYEIPLGKGLAAGNYMVQITAMQKTGRMIKPREIMPGDDPAPQEEELQIIPLKYNTHSQIRVELQPGANTFDQQLVP